MRAHEFIVEGDIPAQPEDLPQDQVSAIKGAISMPGISMNKSNGSAYLQYRFGLALAGAPEYPTKAVGAFSGDPLLSTYTDAELEMINAAAKMVGAGPVLKMSDNRSTELSNVNKTSPVPQNSGKIIRRKK
jgi:hypothetical protein